MYNNETYHACSYYHPDAAGYDLILNNDTSFVTHPGNYISVQRMSQETWMPSMTTKSKYGKNSKSYILTTLTPGVCDTNEVWAIFRLICSPGSVTVLPPRRFLYKTIRF